MERAGIERRKKRKMHRFVIPYPVYKPISFEEIKKSMGKKTTIKRLINYKSNPFNVTGRFK